MFIFWPIFRWSNSHHKGLKTIHVFIQEHHWGVLFKVDRDNLEFLKMTIFWIFEFNFINHPPWDQMELEHSPLQPPTMFHFLGQPRKVISPALGATFMFLLSWLIQ